MRDERVDGPRAVRDRVLLGEGHLRERLRRAVRHEDRVEAEAAPAPLPVRDRPAGLAMEDLVISASPQEEDRLERRAAVAHALQECQDPGAAESLVDVRRVDTGEPAEVIEEQAGIVDEVIPADLVVEDRRGEPHDLLESIRLDLRVGSVLPHDPDARVQELRRDLAELPLVRRDERDHVYRPRSSISRTFRTTASAAFPMIARATRRAEGPSRSSASFAVGPSTYSITILFSTASMS